MLVLSLQLHAAQRTCASAAGTRPPSPPQGN
jgi:hypothetical protein